ncbi:hypothetical protein MNBD_UNCLBAC01-990 [hydrothermal vent metagenome]|uniref:Lipoprotein n=1 Tax=hydrothermal vent metagenome TaxID=652676 RepID=A0A3B1CZL6_9ZZZZ
MKNVLFYLVLCLILASCVAIPVSQVEGITDGMSKEQILTFIEEPEIKTFFNIRGGVVEMWSYVYRRKGFPPKKRQRGWLFFKDNILIRMGAAKNKYQIKTKLIMDAWKGATKQEVIMSWGPPKKEQSDGGTGKILIYTDKGEVTRISGSSVVNVFASNGFGIETGNENYVVDNRETYEYLFYLDAEDIIYHTKWKK